MKNAVPMVLNFSHVYETQRFLADIPHIMKGCSDITGTNGYCDEEAVSEIRRRLDTYAGICFIDNGNYHYVSCIRAGMLNRPFDMIVFDHHTDMQPSMFGNVLSCGSWIRNVILENENLRHVLLIGADGKYIAELRENTDAEELRHVTMISGQEIKGKGMPYGMLNGYEPVFISVDKDVLDRSACLTNWDQGTMKLEMLADILRYISQKRMIYGADICGEPPADALPEAIEQSSRVNMEIFESIAARAVSR